jgi:hypothetical protein
MVLCIYSLNTVQCQGSTPLVSRAEQVADACALVFNLESCEFASGL